MTDSDHAPLALVEDFLQAFAAMDFDTALTFLDDDVEFTNIPMGTVRCHAGAREALEPTAAKIHDAGAA